MYDDNFYDDNFYDDELWHWGVKGMKWKNHVYKTYQKGVAYGKKKYKAIKKKLARLFESKSAKAARLAKAARKKALEPWAKRKKTRDAIKSGEMEKTIRNIGHNIKTGTIKSRTAGKKIVKNIQKIGANQAKYRKQREAALQRTKQREAADREYYNNLVAPIRNKRNAAKTAEAQRRIRTKQGEAATVAAREAKANEVRQQRAEREREQNAIDRIRRQQTIEQNRKFVSNKRAQNAINRINSGQSQRTLDDWTAKQQGKALAEKTAKAQERIRQNQKAAKSPKRKTSSKSR